MLTRHLSMLALGILVACGPIPGGRLSGQTAAIPRDWSAAVPDDRAICEIEARPEKPHSIQLECFVHDRKLYVQSHRWALAGWWPVQSWAGVWIEHPDVRVRLGDELYDVKATRVTDAQERQSVLAFRGYDPVPDGIVLFRFEPRT